MYSKRILPLLAVILVTGWSVACKKGEAIPGSSNGTIMAELLNLPNTPDMDVYFNNTWLDSLLPGKGIGGANQILLPAGSKGTLFFKKKGTDVVLLDTTVTIPTEASLGFRIAYSEYMGFKDFLGAGTTTIDPDSCQVQFFNQLLPDLLPDGMQIDAYLYRLNRETNEYDFITTLHSYQRNKLSPVVLMLPAKQKDGLPFNYFLKYKNLATGEFLIDGIWNEYSNVDLLPGRSIISLSSQIDFGGGLYFFVNESVVL